MCSPLRADELDLVRQAGLDGGSDALTAFLLKRLKKMNEKKKKREPRISEIPRPGHSLLPYTSVVSHTCVSEGLSEALTCSPHPPVQSSPPPPLLIFFPPHIPADAQQQCSRKLAVNPMTSSLCRVRGCAGRMAYFKETKDTLVSLMWYPVTESERKHVHGCHNVCHVANMISYIY